MKRVAPFVARFVRGVKTSEHTDDDGRYHRERGLLAGRGEQTEKAREGLPFDVLHDEQDLALRRDDVECRHDIWVPDACREPRFIEEEGRNLRVPGELRVESLDGYRPRKANRVDEATEIDGCHPTTRELAMKCVSTEELVLFRYIDGGEWPRHVGSLPCPRQGGSHSGGTRSSRVSVVTSVQRAWGGGDDLNESRQPDCRTASFADVLPSGSTRSGRSRPSSCLPFVDPGRRSVELDAHFGRPSTVHRGARRDGEREVGRGVHEVC